MISRHVAFALAGLLGCSNLELSPVSARYGVRTAPAIADVREAVWLDERTVVVSGPVDDWAERRIALTGNGSSKRLATLPEQGPWCPGQALVSGGESVWWYSRCGIRSPVVTVEFVTADAPGDVIAIRTGRSRDDARGWVPIHGRAPSGLLISAAGGDASSLTIDLVSPSGVEEVGRLARDATAFIAAGAWSAQQLHDGATALIVRDASAAGPDTVLVLFVFRGDGIIDRFDLVHAPEASFVSLVTASSDDHLAIVATTTSGDVMSVLFDLTASRVDTTRVLSSAGKGAVATSIALKSVGGRFVAAWTTADGAVRLCEFARTFALPSVEVSAPARRDPALGLQPLNEEIILYSSAPDGTLEWRHLPSRPTGYLVAMDLLRKWQLWIQRVGRRYRRGQNGVAAAAAPTANVLRIRNAITCRCATQERSASRRSRPQCCLSRPVRREQPLRGLGVAERA